MHVSTDVTVPLRVVVRAERKHDDGIDVTVSFNAHDDDGANIAWSCFVRDDMTVDVQRVMWDDGIADNIATTDAGRDEIVTAITNVVVRAR